MGVFGHWEYLLILGVIALIIFGPSRLPELGAGLGKAIREFRKSASEMGDALKEEAQKQPDVTTPTAVGTTYPAAPTPTEPEATPSAQPPAPVPPPEAPKA